MKSHPFGESQDFIYHTYLVPILWILLLVTYAGDWPNAVALEFQWPVVSNSLSSLYGSRADPLHKKLRFHAGIDLPAHYGALVEAAESGVVRFSGWDGHLGRSVRLEHPGGYQTVYAHLSQILVFEGMQIIKGQHLGRVGNSGRSTGPHLHFSILRRGVTLDPLEVLQRPATTKSPER